jgi:hypothetical protein
MRSIQQRPNERMPISTPGTHVERTSREELSSCSRALTAICSHQRRWQANSVHVPIGSYEHRGGIAGVQPISERGTKVCDRRIGSPYGAHRDLDVLLIQPTRDQPST